MVDQDIHISKLTGFVTLVVGGLLVVAISLGAYLNYHAYQSTLLELTRSRLLLVATDLQSSLNNASHQPSKYRQFLVDVMKSEPSIRSIQVSGLSRATDIKWPNKLTPPLSDNTMIIEAPRAVNADADANVAVTLHYALNYERQLLADKRRHLGVISLSGALLLTVLAWITAHLILRPLRSFSRWMAQDFNAVLQGQDTTVPDTPVLWQEETAYLDFQHDTRVILNVLKEAEDYGLTDKPTTRPLP